MQEHEKQFKFYCTFVERVYRQIEEIDRWDRVKLETYLTKLNNASNEIDNFAKYDDNVDEYISYIDKVCELIYKIQSRQAHSLSQKGEPTDITNNESSNVAIKVSRNTSIKELQMPLATTEPKVLEKSIQVSNGKADLPDEHYKQLLGCEGKREINVNLKNFEITSKASTTNQNHSQPTQSNPSNTSQSTQNELNSTNTKNKKNKNKKENNQQKQQTAPNISNIGTANSGANMSNPIGDNLNSDVHRHSSSSAPVSNNNGKFPPNRPQMKKLPFRPNSGSPNQQISNFKYKNNQRNFQNNNQFPPNRYDSNSNLSNFSNSNYKPDKIPFQPNANFNQNRSNDNQQSSLQGDNMSSNDNQNSYQQNSNNHQHRNASQNNSGPTAPYDSFSNRDQDQFSQHHYDQNGNRSDHAPPSNQQFSPNHNSPVKSDNQPNSNRSVNSATQNGNSVENGIYQAPDLNPKCNNSNQAFNGPNGPNTFHDNLGYADYPHQYNHFRPNNNKRGGHNYSPQHHFNKPSRHPVPCHLNGYNINQ